jgi:hypothetical protein
MIAPSEGKLFRIRIGGAHQPRDDDPDMIGVDEIKTDSVDYVIELKMIPWPIENDVVDRIFAAFYFHRIDQHERIAFMNECYRILKPRGQLVMVNPYYSSMRAIMDPRAKWPPICEGSFAFYRKEHREQQNIDCGITCDFDFGCGPTFDGDLDGRNDEYKLMVMKRQLNTVHDLHVTLTARKSPRTEN